MIWAMFEDVGRALADSYFVDKVVVASVDHKAVEYAESRGWGSILEKEQISESQSVDKGVAVLRQEGALCVLRVPLDVPLIEGQDVDSLLGRLLTPPEAVLVPSWSGRGTNALLRTPPDAFPSCFGKDSLDKHLRVARQAGVSVTIVRNPRFALDLDNPTDLLRFWIRGQGTATARFLARRKVIGRLTSQGWSLNV